MSFVKKGASAFGKLLTVVVLGAAFLAGMFGVVYLSLQGEEIKVPEIVGKDFNASEEELAALGLRIKKRADRYSEEKPNTILEQLPRPGETVKTGQMIFVVTSKPNPEGEEKPAKLQKGSLEEEDDSEKIEELISDKPKKKATNTGSTKKKSTTRDVIKEDSNVSSNTSVSGNKNSSEQKNGSTTKDNKNGPPTPSNKSQTPAATDRPAASKTPAGETRPRRTP